MKKNHITRICRICKSLVAEVFRSEQKEFIIFFQSASTSASASLNLSNLIEGLNETTELVEQALFLLGVESILHLPYGGAELVSDALVELHGLREGA